MQMAYLSGMSRDGEKNQAIHAKVSWKTVLCQQWFAIVKQISEYLFRWLIIKGVSLGMKSLKIQHTKYAALHHRCQETMSHATSLLVKISLLMYYKRNQRGKRKGIYFHPVSPCVKYSFDYKTSNEFIYSSRLPSCSKSYMFKNGQYMCPFKCGQTGYHCIKYLENTPGS